MTLDPADTIAAIASPPGPGLRGVIRLSGPDAREVALADFVVDQGQRLPDRLKGRSGRVNGVYRLEMLRPRLPVSLLFWSGPRSYTGQDVVEVHTSGSVPLLEFLLSHFLLRGARQAGPGEFTLRAFLSGRIDLTRAEAVLGVIDARTPSQLSAALDQLGGGLASPLKTLRERLLDILAHLEANLDFNDEADVDELGRSELSESLASSAAELAALADRLKGRDRPEGLPSVVLVGAPNAGKSRLFNALLGRERALVSAIPGTTRDYLSARCECDGLSIRLTDTAGEDEATSAIEIRARDFRAEQAERADLLLVCTPSDALFHLPLPILPPPLPDHRRLLVTTKCDLEPLAGPSEAIATSAATGAGLTMLRKAIALTLRSQTVEDDLATTTGARCRESLIRASESLAAAAIAVGLSLGDELVAIDLRQAIDDLGRVVGVVVTDDILDRIFRKFCIGK